MDEILYNELNRILDRRLILLLGDFNCNKINWDNGTSDAIGDRLLKFSNDNFLQQYVREPTRGLNILDLIFSNDENLVSKIVVGEILGFSDHNLIRFEVNAKIIIVKNLIQKLDYRRANWEGLRASLAEYSLDDAIEDVESLWNLFKDALLQKQEEFVPSIKVSSKTKISPKWFNSEIKQAILDRNKIYKIKKNEPSPQNIQNYVVASRNVKRKIRTAKLNEETRIAAISKTNVKEFFSYVNSRKPIRSHIGPLIKNGIQITDDAGIADELNNYFVTVFNPEEDNNVPNPTIFFDATISGNEPLNQIIVTNEEITQLIIKMRQFKSPGPDKITPRVLKEAMIYIVDKLLIIFNTSLDNGKVPDDWKKANVTPIFKKGKRDDPSNYRPISLTSVVGKLLEGTIANRIVDHLELNNLLLKSQHGFRRHKSCLTNLLEFFHNMHVMHDDSKAVDIVYLDFKKAFDKVPHKSLLAKVRALGIGGKVADWIQDWLQNRKQRVVINGIASGWANVTSGVPQGSVLGPLLFLIYINDLDIGLLSRLAKFADDSKLGTNVGDLEGIKQLQKDLDNVGDWSIKWQMPFNIDKCKVMHVGSRNPNHNYELLGAVLVTTKVEKDLGVYVSDDFKVSTQCKEAVNKANRILSYIKRHFRNRTKEIILPLYNSLVRPHLEYAVQFWCPYLRKDIELLEAVQARATKLVSSIRHKSYIRRCDELNLYTLEFRRLRGQLIQVYKILNHLDKIDYSEMFTLSNNATRNNGFKLVAKRFNTHVCGNFFSFKIINQWNKLPMDIVMSPTIETFKRRLDKILNTLLEA
ncbi:unnamed protein product [Rotaria socialis]|nr:unnamed protein product [Rotaria socialis]